MPTTTKKFHKLAGPRVAAFLLTLIAVAAVALLARPKVGQESSQSPDRPDQCVTAMVVAEKAGDVEAYLDCFTGPLRDKLQRRMAGQSGERLSAQLQGNAAGLTGHVTTDVETTAPDSASVVLERVYRDYNERHRLQLKRVGGAWKITEMTVMERFAPEIPYGTPVYQLQSDAEQATGNAGEPSL